METWHWNVPSKKRSHTNAVVRKERGSGEHSRLRREGFIQRCWACSCAISYREDVTTLKSNLNERCYLPAQSQSTFSAFLQDSVFEKRPLFREHRNTTRCTNMLPHLCPKEQGVPSPVTLPATGGTALLHSSLPLLLWGHNANTSLCVPLQLSGPFVQCPVHSVLGSK